MGLLSLHVNAGPHQELQRPDFSWHAFRITYEPDGF